MPFPRGSLRHLRAGVAMKAFLLAVVMVVAGLSLAACAGKEPFPIGKGKGPPPPIVTKG